MIIKVQLPLYSNEKNPEAFIYNEDRSVTVMLPVSQDIIDAMDGEPKKYFHATVSKKGILNIKAEAPWQDW
jgi:hypothetical protein